MRAAPARRSNQGGAANARDPRLYLRYTKDARQLEADRRAPNPADDWNRRIAYLLGACVCNTDLQARQSDQVRRRSGNPGAHLCKLKGLRKSSWRQNSAFGWFSTLVQCTFIMFAAHLALVLYYQYSLDLARIHLRQSQSAVQLNDSYVTDWSHYQTPAPSPLNGTVAASLARMGRQNLSSSKEMVSRQQLELLARIRHAELRIGQLASSAQSHLAIIVECIYLSTVAYGLIIYQWPVLNHRLLNAFDFHFVRELFDAKQELKNTWHLMEGQVREFIESNRVYLASRRAETCTPRTPTSSALLNMMLDNEALLPLNRIHAWPLLRSKLQLICHIAFAVYAITFDVALIYGAFLFTRTGQDAEFQLRQSLGIVSCAGLLAINLPSVLFHGTVYLIASLDQIVYVCRLERIMRRCIATNTRAFMVYTEGSAGAGGSLSLPGSRKWGQNNGGLRPGTQSTTMPSRRLRSVREDNELIELMNCNYLFALLHYKIFKVQYMPVKSAIGPGIVVSFALLFLMPAIVRLHLDYILQFNTGPVSGDTYKTYVLALSSSVLIPANFTVVPLCYLNSRCHDLYKALASLLAHLSEVKTSVRGAHIYDPHGVSILNKELAHPRQLLRLFVIRSAGIGGTYTALLKAHFWWGLLALSIVMCQRQTIGDRRDIFGNLFNDPLGLTKR
jgi:hypothetical protein